MEAHIVDDVPSMSKISAPAGWFQAFVLEGFGSVVIVGLEQPLGRNRLDAPGGDVDAGAKALVKGISTERPSAAGCRAGRPRRNWRRW